MDVFFLLMVLSSALCGASAQGQQAVVETLMDNVLVLRIPNDLGSSKSVPLTCGEAYQSQSVYWKKNDQELNPPLVGNQVQVLVEEMDGGNYTCHQASDGKYLNHTLILVQLDPDNRTVILEQRSPREGFIHCSSPNYQGTFHCTWQRSKYRTSAAVLLVKAERNLEKLPCDLDADGSGVHCHNTTCPFNEEQHRIALTVYIHSHSRLEAYERLFFIRDIVRPAKVSNLRLVDGKHFTWSYPDTWETPCSYFPLRFQVQLLGNNQTCGSKNALMDNITEEAEFEVDLKHRRYVFCVRAQDNITNSHWSHWSHCTVNKQQATC